MTVKDVASYLKVSEQWVRLHKLDLGVSRIGSNIRFVKASIDTYVTANAWEDAQKLAAKAEIKDVE